MPTTLSPIGIANVALSKIGAQTINSLSDTTNPSALACNNNFNLCYLEVSRSAQWNCILKTAELTQIQQTPLPDFAVPSGAPDWAPLTFYAANTYLAYGGYFYITLFAYTSTNNFLNDLTTGALAQTNLPTNGNPFWNGCGMRYASGWGFEYALPTDFQLLAGVNENMGWWGWDGCGGEGDDFEIMGSSLFTDCSTAVIKYVQSTPDTTKFDSMFTNALTLKLASAISTFLRQDGGKMEAELLQAYEQALRRARTKNAGERKPRRFNIISSSNWNRARYGGVNGRVYVPSFIAKYIWG